MLPLPGGRREESRSRSRCENVHALQSRVAREQEQWAGARKRPHWLVVEESLADEIYAPPDAYQRDEHHPSRNRQADLPPDFLAVHSATACGCTAHGGTPLGREKTATRRVCPMRHSTSSLEPVQKCNRLNSTIATMRRVKTLKVVASCAIGQATESSDYNIVSNVHVLRARRAARTRRQTSPESLMRHAAILRVTARCVACREALDTRARCIRRIRGQCVRVEHATWLRRRVVRRGLRVQVSDSP